MNLDVLYKSVGRKWHDELQCLMPVNLAYPELPIFSGKDCLDTIAETLQRYFRLVGRLEVQKGDLLVFNFGKSRHFGIYAGNNKFFHITRAHSMRISRLGKYEKHLFWCARRRLIG